jgi:hypothetical protein
MVLIRIVEGDPFGIRRFVNVSRAESLPSGWPARHWIKAIRREDAVRPYLAVSPVEWVKRSIYRTVRSSAAAAFGKALMYALSGAGALWLGKVGQ